MSVSTPPLPGATPQEPGERVERCPLCGGPLGREQDWCLRCGGAARTRLAATPRWRPPVIALATVIVLSLGGLTAALVSLAGSSDTEGTVAVTRTVTVPTAGAPATPGAATGATAGTTTGAPGVGATGTTGAPGTSTGSLPGTTAPGASATTTAPPGTSGGAGSATTAPGATQTGTTTGSSTTGASTNGASTAGAARRRATPANS